MSDSESAAVDHFSELVKGAHWEARQWIVGSPYKDPPIENPDDVLSTWPRHLPLIEADGEVAGLRPPQLGAVHALLAYWSTEPSSPATIVMPTGTGKTDTMVAAFVAARSERLLVLVPSDALRDQLAEKFETLGVLRVLKILEPEVHCPIVGRLRGALENGEDALRLLAVCNVIVTTPQALSHSSEEARASLLRGCTHLFVDEAHHVAATTWRSIRDEFYPRPVVQFTATPQRSDQRHIGGVMIYNFPLRVAQAQGYFSKIRYLPVLDLLRPDEAVARAAIDQLRTDLESGYDHVVMARANSIRRAQEVLTLYEAAAPEMKPVLIHSRLRAADVVELRQALDERQSRILVCVDMFGEGFDMPSLKIAALHDQHRTLGITLQFIGRFARNPSSGQLGPATVIAARSEVRHDDALRRLYAEDADWNLLIEDLSARVNEKETEEDQFVRAFNALPEEVSIHGLTPALSTVVYHPQTLRWRPQAVVDTVDEEHLVTNPVPINERDRVLWFVTRSRTDLRWGDVEGAVAEELHLFVVYWDDRRGLLYVHSSDNSSLHQGLARAVSGDQMVVPISGERVFRVFHGVQRLTPTNVGLLDARSRSRRYSSHVGSDVTEAFPRAEAQTKAQTHIAANGWLDGAPYSIAASLKGRIWSHRTASTLKQWSEWCDVVGAKLLDHDINVDSIIADFIRPVALANWPDLVLLAVEPGLKFSDLLAAAEISYKGRKFSWSECGISRVLRKSADIVYFTVESPQWAVDFSASITDSGILVVPRAETEQVLVERARASQFFSELATKLGLLFLFSQDAVVEPPGLLYKPNRTIPPWDRALLEVESWSGVNIRKESWGKERDPGTVQGHMMSRVQQDDWEIIIDDDGSGEVADIVCMSRTDDALSIELIHCKFSSENQPGRRIEDLYELAGQAQRSAGLRRNVDQLFQRLIRRERGRGVRGRTGFVRGSIADLQRIFEISDQLRLSLRITLAQPGMSASGASDAQLELLGAVDTYVSEVANSRIRVFCSA